MDARGVDRSRDAESVVFAGALAMGWLELRVNSLALLLLVCGMPCFVAGLAEDFTKRISPRRRLFFTAQADRRS